MKAISNIIERTCPTCGCNFIPAPYHVYRIGSKYFCKYTCYSKQIRIDPVEKNRRRNERYKKVQADELAEE